MAGYQIVHEELQQLGRRGDRRIGKSPGTGVQTLNDFEQFVSDHEAEDSQGTIMLNNNSTLGANVGAVFIENLTQVQDPKDPPKMTRDTATDTSPKANATDLNKIIAATDMTKIIAQKMNKIREKPPPQ